MDHHIIGFVKYSQDHVLKKRYDPGLLGKCGDNGTDLFPVPEYLPEELQRIGQPEWTPVAENNPFPLVVFHGMVTEIKQVLLPFFHQIFQEMEIEDLHTTGQMRIKGPESKKHLLLRLPVTRGFPGMYHGCTNT